MTGIKIQRSYKLEQQAGSKAQEKKLREAAKLYEKQFLREMVKQMRATVPSSGLLPVSPTEKWIKEKLDHEYVEVWGDQGGIGLADMIYDQLQEQLPGPKPLRAKPMIPLESPEGKPIRLKKAVGESSLYRLERTPESSELSRVVNPWPGAIVEAESEGNSHRLLVQHQDSLSEMHFRGQLKGSLEGKYLDPGYVLGAVTEGGLTWRVSGPLHQRPKFG